MSFESDVPPLTDEEDKSDPDSWSTFSEFPPLEEEKEEEDASEKHRSSISVSQVASEKPPPSLSEAERRKSYYHHGEHQHGHHHHPGKSVVGSSGVGMEEPSSAFSRELCLQGETCAKPVITIGEPEKEQLQSVGRHLLKIGRQLLEEMNFVEGLLGRYGSLGFKGLSNDREKEKEKHENNPCGTTTCGLQPTAKDNTQVVKAQLVEAIAAQAKRLNWIEQATEEYQHATKAVKFGSAFATPDHSKSMVIQGETTTHCSKVESPDPAKVQDIINQELRKRLAVAEMKAEKMSGALEACEKQICDMYSKMQNWMKKMSEDSADLREHVNEDICQSEQARIVVDNRVSHLEAQVMKLAQIVWDLKCETRAQMHFGSGY